MPKANLQNQYRVTLFVDGTDYGVWDTLSGGAIDSEETKYSPGGMAPEISLGGRQTTENVTLGRYYDLERDHQTIKTLIGRVGKGDAEIVKQPLDADGNVFGSPITYGGKLKSINPPEHDSMSSDVAMVEAEISVAGLPS